MDGKIRFKDSIRASLPGLCFSNCRLRPAVKRSLESPQGFATALSLRFAICGAILLLLALTTIVPVRADDAATTPTLKILPGTGPVGTEIIVQISGFPANTGILIAAQDKNVIVQKSITDSDGNAAVTFTLPSQPSGWCEIWAYDDVNEAWAMFTVVPSVELDKTSGYVDDEVAITGHGFSPDNKATVYFDGKEIGEGQTSDEGDLTDLSVKVPKSCKGKHEISVGDSKNAPCTDTGEIPANAKEQGLSCVNSAEFLVRQQLSVSPNPAEVDSNVRLIGTGFSASTDVTVYFDDQDIDIAPADDHGSFDISFRVPQAGGGEHKIKCDDGANKYYADFTVNAGLTCKPSEGSIGQKVTVEGAGFRAGTPITVSYDNQQIETITSSAEGAFTFGFDVPPSIHGDHKITVSDGSTVKEAKFIVESDPPPAPTLISPISGARLTTAESFEWEGVTDPSGVKYMFEIGADEQFSTMILTENNISTTQFSLSEEQQNQLRPGKTPFYWRVKAIDGASNAGQWSDVNSFEVGPSVSAIVKNMPPWVTYLLVGFLIVLVATFFYTLGSRLKSPKQVEYEDDSMYEEDQTSYSNPYDSVRNQGDRRRVKYK